MLIVLEESEEAGGPPDKPMQIRGDLLSDIEQVSGVERLQGGSCFTAFLLCQCSPRPEQVFADAVGETASHHLLSCKFHEAVFFTCSYLNSIVIHFRRLRLCFISSLDIYSPDFMFNKQ